jgi:Rieske Fe-S protein
LPKGISHGRDYSGEFGEKPRIAVLATISQAVLFFFSAFCGAYLLLTDKSLWILAMSHAYGLIVIALVDVFLGTILLLKPKKSSLAGIALASMTLLLQTGDILSAQQFRMTIQYFASYLFGLWPFDAIFVSQVAIIFLGMAGVEKFSDSIARTISDVAHKKSRRDFLIVSSAVAIILIGGLLGFSRSFSSDRAGTSQKSLTESGSSSSSSNQISTTSATQSETSTNPSSTADYTSSQSETSTASTTESQSLSTSIESTTSTDSTTSIDSTTSVVTESASSSSTGSAPIANINDLQILEPVYFEYPSGYPNVLFKRADGTVIALSLLCTHICCEANFEASSAEIVCPCHGSVYDDNGNVLKGPARIALPSITLNIDATGNIKATGIQGSSPCLN